MALTVDISTIRVMEISENGIARIAVAVTEDNGQTFTSLEVPYNVRMAETDLMRVVQAAYEKAQGVYHASEVTSMVASLLTKSGKTFVKNEAKVVPEEVP